MTASLAIIGYGSLFQTSDGNSPPGWITQAEVQSMMLPPLTRDVVDAGHESAPNEWRNVLVGINTAGEIGLNMNFYKTVYQTLFTEFNTFVSKQRRIVLPGGSSLVFDAYLISLEVGLATGELVSAAVKYRVTGQPGPLTIV